MGTRQHEYIEHTTANHISRDVCWENVNDAEISSFYLFFLKLLLLHCFGVLCCFSLDDLFETV